MPPTRAVKSVGRANLLKNIQETLQSSQNVIDDAPENSSNPQLTIKSDPYIVIEWNARPVISDPIFCQMSFAGL